MTSLLGSGQFWFGALLLCAFQFAKFNEIKPFESGLKGRSAVPDLHARDFVGLLPYRVTLVLFVLVTLAGYVVLCPRFAVADRRLDAHRRPADRGRRDRQYRPVVGLSAV